MKFLFVLTKPTNVFFFFSLVIRPTYFTVHQIASAAFVQATDIISNSFWIKNIFWWLFKSKPNLTRSILIGTSIHIDSLSLSLSLSLYIYIYKIRLLSYQMMYEYIKVTNRSPLLSLNV